MFSESQYWYLTTPIPPGQKAAQTGWGSYSGDADYKACWDPDGYGHESVFMDGGVSYRHNEGANIAFYDGHAEWMPKEEMFFYDSSGFLPDHARNTQLWELWK